MFLVLRVAVLVFGLGNHVLGLEGWSLGLGLGNHVLGLEGYNLAVGLPHSLRDPMLSFLKVVRN